MSQMFTHTRENSGIKLDSSLRWWHDDVLVEHPNIIELFNRGLEVAPDGKFILRVGNDWCFVTVEDCAFGVVAVDESADKRLSIRLTDRTAEFLDIHSLKLDAHGELSCAVKRGSARAKFNRQAQLQIGDFLTEKDGALYLASGDAEVRLSAL